uniref:Uncharacterized protein n=2 Tax=viral metagenome TaxID=1070528 RepID=A0A6M3JPX5_9ZZZZ
MTESTQYCKCYEKGNQPALLTDWRKTNICQTCGKLKIHKKREMTPKKDFWKWIGIQCQIIQLVLEGQEDGFKDEVRRREEIILKKITEHIAT